MAGGKTFVLFSGQLTTNSYVNRKFSTLGYGVTNIIVDAITETSGYTLSHQIRGYPATDGASAIPTYYIPLVSDATLRSGYFAQYTVTDAYDQMAVGIKNTTSNKSGSVTVMISRKRRQ